MIARIALFTVAVLAVIAGPAKGRGFERVGSTAHQPFSDGTALVWQATGAALELRRPATGQRRRIAVPSGCRLADVATSRHALVSCGGGAAAGYVLGLRTGGRVALPRASFLTVDRIGAHWVEGYFNPGCHHCDSQVFRNWRTGEERAIDGMDAIQTDLVLRRRLRRWPVAGENVMMWVSFADVAVFLVPVSPWFSLTRGPRPDPGPAALSAFPSLVVFEAPGDRRSV